MFWDCSWVQNNNVNGKNYGKYAFELLQGITIPPSQLPTTHAPPTKPQTTQPTTTKPPTQSPVTTAKPPTGELDINLPLITSSDFTLLSLYLFCNILISTSVPHLRSVAMVHLMPFCEDKFQVESKSKINLQILA